MSLNLESSLQNGIAKICMASPQTANALGPEDMPILRNELKKWTNHPDARVVVLTGTDNIFSAGANINALSDVSPEALRDNCSETLIPICDILSNSKIPTIAALNGPTAGAASGIALMCDFVIAKQSATIMVPFAKLGLIPDAGLTYLLPRLLGEAKAGAIMMLGESISADDADKLGLIYDSVADDNFDEAINRLTEKLSRIPSSSIYSIRKAIAASRSNNIIDQINLEIDLQAEAVSSEEFKRIISSMTNSKSKQ